MENLDLIRRIAWTFEKRQDKIPYDELFAEASFAYAEALHSFNENKDCKLTSYAWSCMYNHLLWVCQKNAYFDPRKNRMSNKSMHKKIRISDIENPDTVLPSYSAEEKIMDKIAELPENCQKIATMVLENPEKWLGETPNFKRTGGAKERIQNALREQGWKWQEIWDGFKDMNKAVKSF